MIGMARKVAACALCAIGLVTPCGASDWTEVGIRGWVDLIEVTAPVLGEPGHVGVGAALNFGLAWRERDPAELAANHEADGLKPLGVYIGAAWRLGDEFGFDWIQPSAGITYEGVASTGLGLWLGNRTLTRGDYVESVPGLDARLVWISGLGVARDLE